MNRTVPCDHYRFLPPLARTRITELRDQVGCEPEVTRLDNGYRVSLTSTRVTLTMDWRRTARARTVWSYNSTLSVDGRRVPVVKNAYQFALLWNDPDLRARPDGEVDLLELSGLFHAELPALGEPPEAIPPVVEFYYRMERSGAAGCDRTTELGFNDGEWQILSTITTEGGRKVEFYIGFRPDDQGRYTADGGSAILAINGRDCTHLAEDLDLSSIGVAWPTADTQPELPVGKPRHETSAARQNSVQVRRATVIRT